MVRWSHWLLGHAAAWQRDDMRLRDLLPRVATLPLGSGAPVAGRRVWGIGVGYGDRATCCRAWPRCRWAQVRQWRAAGFRA